MSEHAEPQTRLYEYDGISLDDFYRSVRGAESSEYRVLRELEEGADPEPISIGGTALGGITKAIVDDKEK